MNLLYESDYILKAHFWGVSQFVCDESDDETRRMNMNNLFEFRIKSVLPSVSLMDDVSMRRADSKKKKENDKGTKENTNVVFCFSSQQ